MRELLSEMIEKIATNIGCSVEELVNAHETTKLAHHASFMNAGKTEEEANTLCLRMASTTLRKKGMKMSRSGCEDYEGVFLSVPRAKDFAELAYNKMDRTLNGLGVDGRELLVAQGQIMLYSPKGDGGYTRTANPSLVAKQPFESGAATTTTVANLPKHTRTLLDGTIYSCVWNNTMPTFPNGNANYRYGAARPLSEPERVSLFLGRKRGTEGDMRLMKVYASGQLSRASFPTLTAGYIAGKANADGTRLYLKPDISMWADDETVANAFPGPPHTWDLQEIADVHMLEGLDSIKEYVSGLDDKSKWDALCAMTLEVIHIDPQDNGGLVISLGDLDYSSLSMPIDLWVPKSQSDYIDFGVGSVLMVIGQGWIGRDDDGRMSVTAWSLVNGITSSETLEEESDDPEGWD